MLRGERYKYVLTEIGSNLLFDLDEDPHELNDRIDDPALATIRADMHEELFEWFRLRRHDVTSTDRLLSAMGDPGMTANRGIAIGYWDEDELAAGKAGTLY